MFMLINYFNQTNSLVNPEEALTEVVVELANLFLEEVPFFKGLPFLLRNLNRVLFLEEA